MTEPHGTPESHSEKDHAPDTHGAATGHAEGAHGHDDHMHAGMALGPVDWRMWAVGVVGVIVALVITAGFVVATSFKFNA
jgi:ABC-type Zn2+ transport system substrate-binding protein/surface adhesin